MKSKITRYVIAGFLIFLIFITGMAVGGYRAFEKGYQEGRKVTNSWWIDKQSRYYESEEVEKKRRNSNYNHL